MFANLYKNSFLSIESGATSSCVWDLPDRDFSVINHSQIDQSRL